MKHEKYSSNQTKLSISILNTTLPLRSYDSAKKAGKLAGIIQVQGLGAVVYDGQTFLDNGIPYIGPLWGEENNNGDNLCWWDGDSQPGISAGTQYTASLKIELALDSDQR